MSWDGILFYCCRAARFAATVTAVWAAWRVWQVRAKRRTPSGKRFALQALFVFYLAAVVEIIALRGGRPAMRSPVQLIPLGTMGPLAAEFVSVCLRRYQTNFLTLSGVLEAAWPLVYNVVGNLVWFVPLGLLGPMMTPRLRGAKQALLASAQLSALLELTQMLLGTGAADVDDILLNALGGLLGWALWAGWHKLTRRRTFHTFNKQKPKAGC